MSPGVLRSDLTVHGAGNPSRVPPSPQGALRLLPSLWCRLVPGTRRDTIAAAVNAFDASTQTTPCVPVFAAGNGDYCELSGGMPQNAR